MLSLNKHTHTQRQYAAAVQTGALVLDLIQKSKLAVRNLFDPSDSEVENVRLKSEENEMIVSQHGNFTMIVTQSFKAVVTDEDEGEGEEKAE